MLSRTTYTGPVKTDFVMPKEWRRAGEFSTRFKQIKGRASAAGLSGFQNHYLISLDFNGRTARKSEIQEGEEIGHWQQKQKCDPGALAARLHDLHGPDDQCNYVERRNEVCKKPNTRHVCGAQQGNQLENRHPHERSGRDVSLSANE